jgi:hypothetical protein
VVQIPIVREPVVQSHPLDFTKPYAYHVKLRSPHTLGHNSLFSAVTTFPPLIQAPGHSFFPLHHTSQRQRVQGGWWPVASPYCMSARWLMALRQELSATLACRRACGLRRMLTAQSWLQPGCRLLMSGILNMLQLRLGDVF